jgi:ribosomal protein L30
MAKFIPTGKTWSELSPALRKRFEAFNLPTLQQRLENVELSLLKITLLKSTIRLPDHVVRSVRALGLKRPHQVVYKKNNSPTRGIINKVNSFKMKPKRKTKRKKKFPNIVFLSSFSQIKHLVDVEVVKPPSWYVPLAQRTAASAEGKKNDEQLD